MCVCACCALKDPDQLMQFLRGMHSLGTLVSPIVITAFDLSRYTHLVDVGGATGHIAQAACLKYPNMRATGTDQLIGLSRHTAL
jgi:acetylserotonin N-methyltransferase